MIFRVAGLEVGLTKKYILFLIKPFFVMLFLSIKNLQD